MGEKVVADEEAEEDPVVEEAFGVDWEGEGLDLWKRRVGEKKGKEKKREEKRRKMKKR